MAVCAIIIWTFRMVDHPLLVPLMTKRLSESEFTRQGVRNLNNIGVRPKSNIGAKNTCPPHLPTAHWESDDMGWRVLRCRLCRMVLDQESAY